MSPLKDRDRTRPRRLVRLGVIRLGHKEKKTRRGRGGKTYEVEYPVQDDHFVLTDAPGLAEVYGDEPREIDVILPLPEVRQNFDAWYQVWAGGVLLCKGDGEFVQYAAPHELIERQGKRVSVRNAAGDTLISDGAAQIAFEWNGAQFEPGELVPCPGAAQDLYPHCVACSKAAILKVMMADPRLFRLGYYQLSTGSGRNYDTILGTLELIHSQAGRVNGIPFKLRLVEEQATYTEGGKRKTTTKWFLQLEPDPDYTRQLYRKTAYQAISDEPVAALPERIEEGELVVIDELEDEAPPTLADAPNDDDWPDPPLDDEPMPEPAPEPAPSAPFDLPTDFAAFAAVAIQKLGYRSNEHVRQTLHNQGIERICTPLGVLEFDPHDGWALLTDKAPQPKPQQGTLV